MIKTPHIATRKGSIQCIDFAKMVANRAEVKPRKPKRSKAARMAVNTAIAARFPGGSADNITQVGMR